MDDIQKIEREVAQIRALAAIEREREKDESREEELRYLWRISDGSAWDAEYRAFKERLRKRIKR